MTLSISILIDVDILKARASREHFSERRLSIVFSSASAEVEINSKKQPKLRTRVGTRKGREISKSGNLPGSHLSTNMYSALLSVFLATVCTPLAPSHISRHLTTPDQANLP